MDTDSKTDSKELEPQITPFIYSDDEVIQIRKGLSGESKLPDDLIEKISGDPLFAECSVAMFFPVTSELISKNNERPVVEPLQTGTRERALKVSFTDCSYVIKSIENSNEPAIATLMAKIGIGPEQYKSLNGYLTETYVEGTVINQLASDRCTPEFMADIGRKVGEAIKQIHAKGILINDQLFSDDMGKSHTIIGSNGEVTFIDFGASIEMKNYPDISDEEVYLILRSTFMGAISLQSQCDEEIPALLNAFRRETLGKYTKDEAIKLFDGQLINEGFSFLSQRIPNIKDMAKGFMEAKK